MSYFTPALRKRKEGPPPRLHMGDALHTLGHYGLSEAAFEPIPDDHPLLRRHHVVERFRTDRRPPRFNKSTKDEAHPFPQRALTNTNSCYNGVDVASSHFPAVVPQSAFLRIPGYKTRGVWDGNVMKAKASHRYNFQCPGLNEPEPPLSYLAEKIVEDASEDRKLLERGWSGDTVLANTFAAGAKEVNYAEYNKRKRKRLLHHYVGPLDNAITTNANRQHEKRTQREADALHSLTLHRRPDAPSVFKMSNIDDWWKMDSLAVCNEQAQLKDRIKANPYQTMYARPSAPSTLATTM